ncbi:hypothetical protein M427DRAFT_42651 [Gonapodya prolifera JEL478]|uniref:G-protein coupled receptors family 2 profile 2 domain-containing protein n=1 Tax=Gonapodya prolifera (strain JEL478) TaxID=1344416 RepID=A0A139ANG4_GONPJ|nr:hypothetical protein M427DRAFT_42651 [Gonapodya prolifera JEL478]|eukprot:KXS18258.1 hypothetical protein M427DRAFT_42651 [Gonapodya prolifera JEL478]
MAIERIIPTLGFAEGLTIQSGVNLSYISSCAICTAIFRTLVLRRPQPEGWVKWLLIGFPIVDSIFMGALTIGQIGATPSGNCWFADATGPIATFTGLKVLIMVLYNLILVAILSIKLSRETAETSKMLSGKGNADQVKSTVDRVSNRMILYPIICLICGGSAVLVQVIFYDNNDAIIFGDQMVAAEGFLNFFAFYVLDPMAHNMATKLVVDLKKNTSRMAPYAKIFCDVVVKLNVASWNTKPKDPVPGSTASSTASGTHSSAQSNAGRKTSTVPLVAHAERPISMGSTSTERSASVAGTTPAVEKTGVADEHNVPTIQEEEAAKDHPRQEATL